MNDFLKRLVEISGNASRMPEAPAETEKLGLELLVRGIGMTLGCMDLCNRDPCAESLGVRVSLQSSQERVLLHLRYLHQLAVSLHCDIEKRGDSSDAGMGAQVRSQGLMFPSLCRRRVQVACVSAMLVGARKLHRVWLFLSPL